MLSRQSFQEAAEELLALVSTHPSATEDILRILYPQNEEATGFEVQCIVETNLTTPDKFLIQERFEVRNVFFEVDRKSVRHEMVPTNTLVPEGEVYVMVGIRSENEKRTNLLRELAGQQVSVEEYFRRNSEILAEESFLRICHPGSQGIVSNPFLVLPLDTKASLQR